MDTNTQAGKGKKVIFLSIQYISRCAHDWLIQGMFTGTVIIQNRAMTV